MAVESHPWKDVIEERLASIAELAEDWDSYGAPPISRTAIDTAKAVLGALSVLSAAFPTLPCPSIVPTADGSVDLEWNPKGGAWASVEIEATGQILALGHDAERVDVQGPGWPE